MTARKVFLVLGWLALIDIVPTLVSGALFLTTDGASFHPPWLSVLWSLTSLPLGLLWHPVGPGAGLLLDMLSLFLALLVPWLLLANAAALPSPPDRAGGESLPRRGR